jgi:hypothetical protein
MGIPRRQRQEASLIAVPNEYEAILGTPLCPPTFAGEALNGCRHFRV